MACRQIPHAFTFLKLVILKAHAHTHTPVQHSCPASHPGAPFVHPRAHCPPPLLSRAASRSSPRHPGAPPSPAPGLLPPDPPRCPAVPVDLHSVPLPPESDPVLVQHRRFSPLLLSPSRSLPGSPPPLPNNQPPSTARCRDLPLSQTPLPGPIALLSRSPPVPPVAGRTQSRQERQNPVMLPAARPAEPPRPPRSARPPRPGPTTPLQPEGEGGRQSHLPPHTHTQTTPAAPTGTPAEVNPAVTRTPQPQQRGCDLRGPTPIPPPSTLSLLHAYLAHAGMCQQGQGTEGDSTSYTAMPLRSRDEGNGCRLTSWGRPVRRGRRQDTKDFHQRTKVAKHQLSRVMVPLPGGHPAGGVAGARPPTRAHSGRRLRAGSQAGSTVPAHVLQCLGGSQLRHAPPPPSPPPRTQSSGPGTPRFIHLPPPLPTSHTSSWPRYKRRSRQAWHGHGGMPQSLQHLVSTSEHPTAPRPQGTTMAKDRELNRIIKDLQKTVAELNHIYRERNLPVTDGSRELHSLCAQLEFLLQFDLKEKRSFFGQRKDYWDFLCQGLARCRQEHEGIHFVTSLDKLKTPVGRGRAFLRYCLVHRQLAESLQLCLLDTESLCEWYYARSPFLSPQSRAEILGTLYELDGITFHLALYRADLDIAWPMFSESLVRSSPVAGNSPAKAVLQRGDTSKGTHGWSDGIVHPATAPHGVLGCPYPNALAALEARGVEMEDVEVKKAVEEEGEEEVKEDVQVDVEGDAEVENNTEEDEEELEDGEETAKVDVEELEDTHDAGNTPHPDSDRDPGMSPPTGTGCMPGSSPPVPRQLGGTEVSLEVLVSQLQAELGQREVTSRELASQLALEERRHRRWEESSTRWARVGEQEAEALRETNAFLERVLVAAGAQGELARAQEEARGWQEVAEERGAQLAAALAEVSALASRLRACQEALEAAGQTETLEDGGAVGEVAAVKEVLRKALELAHGPQEPLTDPQEEGEPSTATSMAMHLATLVTTAREEARQSRQQLQAQQQEMARLQEQLSRAQQDGERWASALQRAQREALEREATRGAEQARQQELIRDMKGRLLELLREKDALWQKTEGIDTPVPSPAPRDAGLCIRCHKDFRLLSRRYHCRMCQGKVCHACSVDVGKQGRCCLLCYQQAT
ncbi:RUN and FYVE domain-containing protein 4 [Phaethornis superciliosus]